MALADYIYRLKPESGDASPHNEVGGGHILSGGTITLVDRGGGDYAWQFEGGPSSATVPGVTHVPGGATGGHTVAITIKVVAFPTTSFETLIDFWASSNANYRHAIQWTGTTNLRSRFAISSSVVQALNAVGTTEHTFVFRVRSNGASVDEYDFWETTVGRVGDAANNTQAMTGEPLGATLNTLRMGAVSPAVFQVANYVIWSEELPAADCAALADNGVRTTLDGGTPTAYTLTADAGSYSLTGQAATLTKTTVGLSLAADAGSYALTGRAANLGVARALAAATGSYTLNGSDAAADFVMSAAAGSYSLSGQDAALTYTAAGAYTLLAEPGAYSLSSVGATLTGPPRSTSTGGYRYYAEIGGKRIHGTLEEIRRLVRQIAEQDAEETVEQAIPPKPAAVRIKAGRAVKRAMEKAAPEVAKQEVEQARESMQDAYQKAFRAAVSELAARRIEQDEEEAMLLLL